MNFFERMQFRFFLLQAVVIVLFAAALTPLNINRMGGDIEQQIERQLLEERSR